MSLAMRLSPRFTPPTEYVEKDTTISEIKVEYKKAVAGRGTIVHHVYRQ